MLKPTVVLSSLLLLVNAAHAQLGFRAGGNLTHLTTPPIPYGVRLDADGHTSSQGGYQLGVFYAFPLSKRFAVVPEGQFSREQVQVNSYDYRRADGEFNSTYRAHFSYVTIPVLLRATFGPFYLEAGPQAGFLVGSRQTGTVTLLSMGYPPADTTYNFEDGLGTRYHRFDVGPCVGLGVRLAQGLHLSVRAYQGLLSVTRAQERTTQNYTTGLREGMHRQSLQASLAFQFPPRQAAE